MARYEYSINAWFCSDTEFSESKILRTFRRLLEMDFDADEWDIDVDTQEVKE